MKPDTTSPLGKDLVRAQTEALTAAERGDQLAFTALVERIGSLEEAQKLVRDRAYVRMAERGTARMLPLDLLLDARTRDVGDGTGDPTLFGHFAVFNEWTEIDSIFEGNFLERNAPGAFKKTINENRDSMRVTFQHGYDPFLGDKILGNIARLEEDEIGAAYEVPLFRGLPDLLMEGLRAGAYGASYRFRVMREEFDNDPDPSDDNPHGLPERTIKEAQVLEFGPVTFPAYPSATAGLRSAPEDANGDGAEVTDAPSKADAAGEEHLGDTRRRSETDTSSAERRETVKTWPKVTDEEWYQLWNRET